MKKRKNKFAMKEKKEMKNISKVFQTTRENCRDGMVNLKVNYG